MKPLLACSLLALGMCASVGAEDGWKSLFDGKTLDGWKQINGTAKYEVHEGTIRGWTVAGSPNSFLCTTRDYADFELEFEVKVDDRLNSGMQFRSQSRPDFKNGRVHGYQVEIATNGNAGLIYDEARRGKWLNPERQVDGKVGGKAFRNGQWNKFRVVCEGSSIKTWINGIMISELTDDMTGSGFIGLQVHSFDGDTPAWVQWRNIRIKER